MNFELKFQRAIKRNPRPDMLPMIDVVFFLLIFFMLFTTIQTAPAGLDVELPRAATGTAQEDRQLEIHVSRDGLFYIEGRQVTTADLRSHLERALQVNPELFVIVKADRQVQYEHVISAMDQVRAVGGTKLGLAVQQDI